MLKELINGQSKTITGAALIIAASSLISRFLGMIRDRVLAGQFGAGEILDIYYASFRLPDLVYSLLVFGALSAGFIPVFMKFLKIDKSEVENEGWLVASAVLNLLVLFLFVICGFLAVFASKFIGFITPGFGEEERRIAVVMTRIMFLSPFFLGISALFGGILQSLRKFFIYSLAPIIYNLGIIAGAIFLTPRWGIYGLAWGVIIGAFFHLVIQIPAVLALGFKYKLIFTLRHPAVLKIFKLMIPRILTLAVSQFNLLVITIIASTLASGSITVFNLANNLQSFPLGVFGLSFAVAAFPTFAYYFSHNQKREFVNSFQNTVRQILFFILPATILLLSLRAQIVRIILGVGKFDWADTILTLDSLGYFALSLFAQALIPLLVRAFYAFNNTLTPFFIGLFSTLVNVLASLYLSRHLGVAGLALAFSLASLVNAVLLWLVLKIKMGDLGEKIIIDSIFKVSLGGFFMALIIQLMKQILASFVDMQTFLGVFIQGAGAGLVGVSVFIIVCLLVKSTEMRLIINSLKYRLFRIKDSIDIGEGREV